MRRVIIISIFLIFFASSSYYAAIAPEIFTPLTPYTNLDANELSLLYIVSMVILTIIFIYLLARSIISSIMKYLNKSKSD